MHFETVVKNNTISVPDELSVPDGTIVRVETVPLQHTFAGLLEFAGCWAGDDAEKVLEEIHRSRSSAPPRAAID